MKNSSIVLPPFAVLITVALLVMLGLQGLVEYRLLAPLEADMVRLNQEIRQVKDGAAKISPHAAGAKPTITTRLETVVARLEPPNNTSTRIQALHQSATEHSVSLRKAAYRRHMLPGGIVRHEVQTELAGAYPAIRQFLRTVLAQDPAAALDSLEFSRPSASGSVRAQVKLSLYLRELPQ